MSTKYPMKFMKWIFVNGLYDLPYIDSRNKDFSVLALLVLLICSVYIVKIDQGLPTKGFQIQTQSWNRERLGVSSSSSFASDEVSSPGPLKRTFFWIFPGVVVDALAKASRLFTKSWWPQATTRYIINTEITLEQDNTLDEFRWWVRTVYHLDNDFYDFYL